MNPITYTSEQPSDYSKGLSACRNIVELVFFLNGYKSIASDALEAAPKTDAEFTKFAKGLKKERRGVFAGVKFTECYGAVMMPALMMRVSLIADQFKVPWGCAFIRLKEAGKIRKGKDGIYQVQP